MLSIASRFNFVTHAAIHNGTMINDGVEEFLADEFEVRSAAETTTGPLTTGGRERDVRENDGGVEHGMTRLPKRFAVIESSQGVIQPVAGIHELCFVNRVSGQLMWMGSEWQWFDESQLNDWRESCVAGATEVGRTAETPSTCIKISHHNMLGIQKMFIQFC